MRAPEETVAAAGEQGDKIEAWRVEVLRRAEQALSGRIVGLWEATGNSVVPIPVRRDRSLPPGVRDEINRAIRSWKVPVATGTRWLAVRLDMGRWCIAPVRSDIPAPPPHGVERRRRERMTLELAGLALGLIEERFATEARAPAAKA